MRILLLRGQTALPFPLPEVDRAYITRRTGRRPSEVRRGVGTIRWRRTSRGRGLAAFACGTLAFFVAACAGDGGAGDTPLPTPSASVTPLATAVASPTAPAPPPPPSPSETPRPTASVTFTPTASVTLTPTASVTLTPTAEGARIVVHLGERLGAVDDALLGVGWNIGALEEIAPLVPRSVRIDAHLDAISPAPGELHLGALHDDIKRVRAAGAEPLVILYPMPAWLGAPRADTCTAPVVGGPCSPLLVAPADSAAWEQLITTVVRAVATAPQPALRFEVWNEPDLFSFWQDTRAAFYGTAVHTHRAVASVAAETGLPLTIGGPAASFFELKGVVEGSDDFVAGYVGAVVDAGLPLGFVSWHWYANYPRLGPDGNEGGMPDAVYRLLAGVNKRATPSSYAALTERVCAKIAPILQAAGRTPQLIIDEWNLSAGGYDRRHDTHTGAAFAAGTLIEMERVGLDGANVYRAIAAGEHAGDWGIVAADGAKKPIWWVFWAWSQMAGERLRADGDDPASGLWARAVVADGGLHVLLASFVASGAAPRSVQVEFDGDCTAGVAEIASLDETSSSLEATREQPISNGSVALNLGADSVTWVRVACG
jgi:hypothetical protein